VLANVDVGSRLHTELTGRKVRNYRKAEAAPSGALDLGARWFPNPDA
jgi:hypothetical protein